MLRTQQSNSLLEKLQSKQGNLSDSKFSETLKTSPQLWQATRSGKRKIGSTIIRGFAPMYPDLALDVLELFGFNVSEVIELLNNRTDAHETHHNDHTSGFVKKVRDYFRRS